MITNFRNLATTPLRRKALLIAEAGYEAIDIQNLVKKRIQLDGANLKIATVSGSVQKRRLVNLERYKGVYIIGIGKGSALASTSLAKILGNKLSGGIALDIHKPTFKSSILNLKSLVGTHPLPSIQNIKATQKIIELARGLTEKDLLIAFICGGGSALSCASKKELKQFVLATKELTKAGADIVELNTVRKHLSDFKGGGLAKITYPTTVISLIVSDVLGNDLSMVASGPTVYDKTTKKDAERIWRKYQPNIRTSDVLRVNEDNFGTSDVLNIKFHETPKDKKYFQKVKNVLFLSNREPLTAMKDKAKKLGFKPKIYSYNLKGEAKYALLPLMEAIKSNGVLLAGGETTVALENSKFKNQKSKLCRFYRVSSTKSGQFKIKKLGKGGRNQEAVLGAICDLQSVTGNSSVIISLASDGRDNTEAAGAIGDYLVLEKAQRLKLNPEKFLENHDSFNFFKETNDLIFAEPKSFNVADLMVILKENSKFKYQNN